MQIKQVGRYKISFPIKRGLYAETYRASDDSGKNYFLKLINKAKLSDQQYSSSGQGITELEIVSTLDHPNLIHAVDKGEAIIDGQKFSFLVCDFIAGETVFEKVSREKHCSVYDIKQIATGVLNGLKYLHKGTDPIIHNEITAQNIMLDMSKNMVVPVLIDFGHAQRLMADNQLYYEGLNPFYMAPEMFHGVYSTRTDLYSVGVLMYYLLFGIMPWNVDLRDVSNEDYARVIQEARKTSLKFPDINIFELDDDLLNIIAKALNQDVDHRFQNANEFLMALNGEIIVRGSSYEKVDIKQNEKKSTANVKKGNGFADVAGLDDLKARLQTEVIDLFRNPERYEKLRVKVPNGILLYGPPGCGKTFIGEKLAEELGCNYVYVRCSDVASPYIHGGQEKIAALFEKARKNAPTVLFLDEIDAMVADRSRHTNVSEYGEVNEFLTQLNNCADNKVLVIGATNNPQGIDPAALRSGRLDIKVYVPIPDDDTREKLLRLYLKDIDSDDIDYAELAKITQGYVSKDIAVLVNRAALLSARHNLEKVEMKFLLTAIENSKGELPSVSASELSQHERIKDEFEGRKSRRQIGFKN